MIIYTFELSDKPSDIKEQRHVCCEHPDLYNYYFLRENKSSHIFEFDGCSGPDWRASEFAEAIRQVFRLELPECKSDDAVLAWMLENPDKIKCELFRNKYIIVTKKEAKK